MVLLDRTTIVDALPRLNARLQARGENYLARA